MVLPVYGAQAVSVSRDNHHAASGRLDAFERELNGHSDRSDNGADNYGPGKDGNLALFGRDHRGDARG
jgi:hypothetical protein